MIGLVLFAIGMLVTGSSIDERDDRAIGCCSGRSTRSSRGSRGPSARSRGADWSAVLGQWAGILTAVFVAVIAILFNISGTEVVLHRDLDTNQELRDAGVLNVISGALGGIPGYHALSLTALAERMNVDARVAGLIAAAVPLAAVVFGASVIELIPRMIVGGVLVFLGLAFLVEWVWDKRKVLPPVEYGVVLVILAAIIGKGFLPGVVVGLVLAVVLFAVNYGRIELVREVAFGETYHSNVDRPPSERAALRSLGDAVQILRVNGFVFFGSANGLLERIRKRVEAGPLRFLVIDLRRVTGVDSSAVVAFVKVVHLAEASGFELVFTGVSDPVRKQLERGGLVASQVVRFEPDLDRGLQRCEEGLLGDEAVRPAELDGDALAGMPARPAALPGAGRTAAWHGADPPGRAARRRVCGGVGPAERGDGDGRRDPDARSDGERRSRRRRGRDLHGRPAHRGRGGRDPQRGLSAQRRGRSNGWSPRIPSWPRRCTGGSRASSRIGCETPCGSSTPCWTRGGDHVRGATVGGLVDPARRRRDHRRGRGRSSRSRSRPSCSAARYPATWETASACTSSRPP